MMVVGLPREMIPSMVPIFVVLVFAPFVPLLTGYLQARQWQKLNPPGHRNLTVTFGEDAFRSSSYVGSSDIRWIAVKQVVETPEFLLIYVTEKIAHYVPKRAIAAAELPLVRQLLSSRVDSRRVHLMPTL